MNGKICSTLLQNSVWTCYQTLLPYFFFLHHSFLLHSFSVFIILMGSWGFGITNLYFPFVRSVQGIYISSLHPHRALLLEERATGTIFYCSYLTSIQSSLMASILLLGWGDYKSWFALVYPSILSILMFVLYFSFFKQKNFIFKKQ